MQLTKFLPHLLELPCFHCSFTPGLTCYALLSYPELLSSAPRTQPEVGRRQREVGSRMLRIPFAWLGRQRRLFSRDHVVGSWNTLFSVDAQEDVIRRLGGLKFSSDMSRSVHCNSIIIHTSTCFDWHSVVDTEDSAFLCSVPTLLLYQMPLNSGTFSDNRQVFCLKQRLKCAGLGEIKENEVSSQDYYQTQKVPQKPPKASHLERGAHLRSRFQPSYMIMGGHLQKERRGCLPGPRYMTTSHYQNVPSEIAATQITGDDCPEQQVKKDDSAEFQIQEDDSSDHKDTEQPFKIEIGDVQELRQKIDTEVDSMDRKVLDFKNRYNRTLRPMLVSRGLILPHDLKHPSTLFVHRQTFKILSFNPLYLSSFDVTAYECGVREGQEWQYFLQHMVKKRVYVVEDWDSTISTVETLMYDHGLKGPEDGTELDFYKGECDASFDNGISTLSCIIWKGDKIIYSAVYKDISCTSPTEAEAYAAFALLSKAREMMIEKLLVCCDCKPICKILSGELSIGMHHKHRNLYLMLRSMKRLFKKLIVMWKPRELMLFVDDLAKASTMSISSPIFPEQSMQRWSHHMNGLPLFRIERTEDTNKMISKFAKSTVDESYAENKDVTFYIEVDDNSKLLDCLQGLKQSFKPDILHVFVTGDKSDIFNGEFEKLVDSSSEKTWGDDVWYSGDYKTYTDTPRTVVSDLVLVVVCGASVPKGAYYHDGAFHVILVTPDERKNLIELDVPELNALSFVYFNGVKFPLNESSADSNWRKGRKDDEDSKFNREGRGCSKQCGPSTGGLRIFQRLSGFFKRFWE